ncbi:MAG: MoaD/ThiS family protein [Nitrosomonadales bacterium]|nr:MoaD/ThiS family protein [Nitrosomonadales bacterium]
MIKVLFFGPVAERIGNNQAMVAFRPGIRLQEVRDGLAAQYPQAFEIVCFAAANGEHVRDMSLLLSDNSEVAFMARFSGG